MKHPHLDQARDPLGQYFRPAEELYDAYLNHDYLRNSKLQSEGWKTHYERMRLRIERFLLGYVQDGTGRKFATSNIAIVGPGLDPAHTDFDPSFVANFIADFKSVVVVDFSRHVCRRAMHSLQLPDDAVGYTGVQDSKLLEMQYDVTNGLSAMLLRYFTKHLDKLHTLDDLEAFAQHLRSIDILQELNQEFEDAYEEKHSARTQAAEFSVQSYASQMPDDEDDGGKKAPWNTARNWKLTKGQEPIPLDVVSLQMVLAGTAAGGAEAMFWKRCREIIQQAMEGGAEVPGAAQTQVEDIVEAMYGVICRYNTEVSVRALNGILMGNPDAKIVAVTDITTQCVSKLIPNLGKYQRLNIPELKDRLMQNKQMNIKVREKDVWHWRDEVNDNDPFSHFHEINGLYVERARNGKLLTPVPPITLPPAGADGAEKGVIGGSAESVS